MSLYKVTTAQYNTGATATTRTGIFEEKKREKKCDSFARLI
jgi:hypothetical protein